MNETTPSYYAVTNAHVRYDSELSDKAKLMYGEITCLTDINGVCVIDSSYFANLYNISERQVTRIINLLEKRNHIRVHRGINNCTAQLVRI